MYRLESLEIHDTRDPISSACLLSPPSLKRFALHSTKMSQLQKIWDLCLFAGLTSLDITFNDEPELSHAIWLADLVSLICNTSPALTNLCIDFGDMDLKINIIAPLQPLATLPLRMVSLKYVTTMDKSALSQMALAWPMVTKLEMPDLVVSLGELHYFSRLPKLEHLVVSLWFESPKVNSAIPTHVLLAFHTLESVNEVKVDISFSSLARYVQFLLLTHTFSNFVAILSQSSIIIVAKHSTCYLD